MPVDKIGFIGTGAIADAMVRGLLAKPAFVPQVTISPRNAEIAQCLAADFAEVSIATDNQAVIDASDMVVLAVRPQIAQDALNGLTFRKGQPVISVIAATSSKTLSEWIGADVHLVQAIPLPFVADREGVTAVFPPDPDVAALFSVLGMAVECETKEEYDLLAAASALMSTVLGIMDVSAAWLEQRGLAKGKGRAYIAPLFASLSQTALRSSTIPLEELSGEFATNGGLNEQVQSDFEKNGGHDALILALDRVLARIQGDPSA
ncbi:MULTISPECIES: pyrroline-5-carboxylate reductase [Rhizobium]|uniref:Pyrroline-5-carboxylate reductase n=1 Tax=Rhizobium favelukesii TaxID=348824 RepID=W6RPI9_9HYPH|nr:MULTISPECIES: pyrroline-5-carboxylate reductase [Rhizobium]MCS0462632.1 NAD(P)-binding domain-containing protein [Rhizobium favelukesii]UFS79395.1 NAD(P)-binding domain-containing protein [Rhizobium sp. T136]CDM62952.1 pyrroline-5-carboxylate reductase [Rhizobium favelukesii]